MSARNNHSLSWCHQRCVLWGLWGRRHFLFCSASGGHLYPMAPHLFLTLQGNVTSLCFSESVFLPAHQKHKNTVLLRSPVIWLQSPRWCTLTRPGQVLAQSLVEPFSMIGYHIPAFQKLKCTHLEEGGIFFLSHNSYLFLEKFSQWLISVERGWPTTHKVLIGCMCGCIN